MSKDRVNHPSHYGGEHYPYEAIKVIEAWELGFCLGNAVKYIARAGRKAGETLLDDLKKARWYVDREIKRLEAEYADAAEAVALAEEGIEEAEQLIRSVETEEPLRDVVEDARFHSISLSHLSDSDLRALGRALGDENERRAKAGTATPAQG